MGGLPQKKDKMKKSKKQAKKKRMMKRRKQRRNESMSLEDWSLISGNLIAAMRMMEDTEDGPDEPDLDAFDMTYQDWYRDIGQYNEPNKYPLISYSGRTLCDPLAFLADEGIGSESTVKLMGSSKFEPAFDGPLMIFCTVEGRDSTIVLSVASDTAVGGLASRIMEEMQ